MELTFENIRKLEEYGWPTAGHGFVVCDCCSNVAREEECVCFQDYLHAVMHGEISQPQPEEKPSE
jgi:hypothetical protein